MKTQKQEKTIAKGNKPNNVAKAWIRKLLEKIGGEFSAEVELLDLPGWRSLYTIKSSHDLIIIAAPGTEISACPGCGARAPSIQRYGLTRQKYVCDVPIRGKRVRIYFQVQRYKCTIRKCRKIFLQPVAGIDPRRKVTDRLVQFIEIEAFRVNKTFVMVADEVGVSEQIVRNIFTDCAELLEKSRIIETPPWLAIDEVYIKKKARCVLTAPASRRFVDILFGNDQQTVLKALLQLPDRRKVEVVTIDMSSPYYGVVRRVLPQAAIVIDRYHVQEMANRALKVVLSELRKYKGYTWRRKYMRDPSLLLKRRYELNERKNGVKKKGDKEIVNEWLEQVPEVKVAYQLKEEFCDIWDLPDRREAEERYKLWARRVEGLLPHPFGSILVNMKKWHREIFNYFEYHDCFQFRVTNAFAEAANNVIKTAQRLGKGYRFWVIRAKIIHGGGFVTRRPPHPLDNKRRRSRARSTAKGKKYPPDSISENPNSNVARLKRAYEERDKTRGLRRVNPRDNKAWSNRFENLNKPKDP